MTDIRINISMLKFNSFTLGYTIYSLIVTSNSSLGCNYQLFTEFLGFSFSPHTTHTDSWRGILAILDAIDSSPYRKLSDSVLVNTRNRILKMYTNFTVILSVVRKLYS